MFRRATHRPYLPSGACTGPVGTIATPIVANRHPDILGRSRSRDLSISEGAMSTIRDPLEKQRTLAAGLCG